MKKKTWQLADLAFLRRSASAPKYNSLDCVKIGEAYSEPCQTSRMKCFAKTLNGF